MSHKESNQNNVATRDARTDTKFIRLAALRDRLARADVDAMLVSSLPNIRYLTGFSGSNALVVVTSRECLLLTDFRYASQVADEVGSQTTVRVETQSLWTGLWAWLAASVGIERVGFETMHLLHRDFQRLLEQGARWQWRPLTDEIESLRECKDASELACIEAAIGIAERVLRRTLEQLRVGLSETAVAGILEHALRSEGSEGFPFATIVASGERSALPHARAGNRVVGHGDMVLIDFGAISEGYCSDITRTVVLGRADARQKEIYDVVAQANAKSSGAVRVGLRGMDADAVARDYIHARGYGEAFGHSLGHGIGLEIHEAPRLAKTADGLLATGAVVTVEPGVYLAGWGGVRIEDDVFLASDGPRVLTTFTRELLEIT
ncbi:MAG: aminopeptidase P family protein [Gemmatimonadota bacterium]|nr:aminopeptidase P family protein [Gemmatimonadota bacterium]